jgi:hypothetical protein
MFRNLQTTSYGARLNRARAQQTDWINRLSSLLIPMIEGYFRDLYQQCVSIYGQYHRKSSEQLYSHGCETVVKKMPDADIQKYFIGPNEKSLSECLKVSVQAYGEVLALANRHDKKEIVSVPPIIVFIRRVILQFVNDVSFVDLKQELHNKAAVRSWLERIIEREVRDILPLDRFKEETSRSDEELSGAEDDAQRLSDEEEEEADVVEEKKITSPAEASKEVPPKEAIEMQKEEVHPEEVLKPDEPTKEEVHQEEVPKPEEPKKEEGHKEEVPKPEIPKEEEVVVVTKAPIQKSETEEPKKDQDQEPISAEGEAVTQEIEEEEEKEEEKEDEKEGKKKKSKRKN